MNSLVLGVIVLLGFSQHGAAYSRDPRTQHGLRGRGARGVAYSGARTEDSKARALLSVRDPQCTMPTADPCTLNTTAIGMVESGFATYYDEDCESKGFEGCFTDNIPSCRTCYLSIDMYLAATNATQFNRPQWASCPCCVTTTLAAGHVDLEVQWFDYSVFNISNDACTDAPTQAPTPAPTRPPAVPTPAPTLAPSTPSPTLAPVPPTPPPMTVSIEVTPAPVVSTDRGLGTPGPTSSVLGTPAPSASSVDTPAPSSSLTTSAVTGATPSPSSTSENLSETGASAAGGDSDGGMSNGTKIGIGAGVAAGVVILGLAGFGAYKASGRG